MKIRQGEQRSDRLAVLQVQTRYFVLVEITDIDSMPPRCCSLIQIHVVSDNISPDVASKYREKFEEW